VVGRNGRCGWLELQGQHKSVWSAQKQSVGWMNLRRDENVMG